MSSLRHVGPIIRRESLRKVQKAHRCNILDFLYVHIECNGHCVNSGLFVHMQFGRTEACCRDFHSGER